MRFGRFFAPAVLLLSCSQAENALSQLTYTIPVVDTSARNSPLSVSGTASFTETKVRNAFNTSSSFQIILKNASTKKILLLLAEINQTGPHGLPVRHEIKRDHFFWGEMPVGSAVRMISDETGAASRAPVTPANDPSAEFQVRYIQFSDGTAWGDRSLARDSMTTRRVILELLRLLESARDDQHFLTLLNTKVLDDEANAFLDNFRRVSRRKGVSAVREQVRFSLDTALANESEMRSVRAEK